MTRHYRGLPVDQQDTDVIPAVPRTEVTAAMPVVDGGWFRTGPGSHRRERDGRVSWWWLLPVVMVAGFGFAINAALQSQGGGTVRASVLPSAAPVSSVPHVVISAPALHTPRPVDRVRTRRPYIPVLPAPTHTRPRVTPRASVKPSLTPSHSTHSATPAPTITVPTEKPTASGVTHTSSKETPCPA